VTEEKITQIYLLAAVLSARAEKNPVVAWTLNIQGLLNVLTVAKLERLEKIFWPSSIAVFGPGSPKALCPQWAVREPSTVFGISKLAGEGWCQYYHPKFGIDECSIRFPGIVSHGATPGGGTTDWAVEMFRHSGDQQEYTCFLRSDTILPIIYMPDAIRATREQMDAPAANLTIRTAYNLAAMGFSPSDLEREIQKHLPKFSVRCEPDSRQAIAGCTPHSIDDGVATSDWAWKPKFGLSEMAEDMLFQLVQQRKAPPAWALNTSLNS
jgi:nucleoside-diphosphate-sugar epimerase